LPFKQWLFDGGWRLWLWLWRRLRLQARCFHGGHKLRRRNGLSRLYRRFLRRLLPKLLAGVAELEQAAKKSGLRRLVVFRSCAHALLTRFLRKSEKPFS